MKAKESSILSVTREIVFGAGLPVLLPAIWGLYALPFFMPASDILTFLAVAFVLAGTRKTLLKKPVETAVSERE